MAGKDDRAIMVENLRILDETLLEWRRQFAQEIDWRPIALSLGIQELRMMGLPVMLSQPAPPALRPAALGMVGEEWHGPSPPGEGWVQVGTGPRGGRIWRKAGAAPKTAPPARAKAASPPSSVPGYPKPAARNGRDPDASGLAARGTRARLFRPWDPDARAAAIGKLLKAAGSGKPGQWTQGNATLMEKVFAEVLNFDHWDSTFPADVAGVVRCADGLNRRVGIDLKTAVTQSEGTVKRDDTAEVQKIDFSAEDFDLAARIGGTRADSRSLMFFLAVNANRTVERVPQVDPVTGQVRRDARGQPVMRQAALLYLEAGVRGSPYRAMTPIEIEGLNDVSDLTNPTLLAQVREKVLQHIRNTDPAQFAAQVKTSGERLYERTTRRRARDLDTLATAGVEISDRDEALRAAGQALKKADKALKERRDLQQDLRQKDQQLQQQKEQQITFLRGLYATAQGPMRQQIADQLARLGVKV
jgi:hypothetical protein